MTRVCKKCDNARRTVSEKNKAYHNHPRRCKTCGSFFYASLASMNKTNKRSSRKNGGSFCSVECMHKSESISFGMKGKSWNGRRKGSNNPAAILNEEKVKNIRMSLMSGDSPLLLANFYGVTRNQIYSIKNYRTWKHVIINERNHI